MRKNLEEIREILEWLAYEYLTALYHSRPIHREESPSVFLTRGKLQGACIMADGIEFKVIKRWKIIFSKKDKVWFEYTLENMTEEEADEILDNMIQEERELEKTRRIFGF